MTTKLPPTIGHRGTRKMGKMRSHKRFISRVKLLVDGTWRAKERRQRVTVDVSHSGCWRWWERPAAAQTRPADPSGEGARRRPR